MYLNTAQALVCFHRQFLRFYRVRIYRVPFIFHGFLTFYTFCTLSHFLNYVSRLPGSICKEQFRVEVFLKLSLYSTSTCTKNKCITRKTAGAICGTLCLTSLIKMGLQV